MVRLTLSAVILAIGFPVAAPAKEEPSMIAVCADVAQAIFWYESMTRAVLKPYSGQHRSAGRYFVVTLSFENGANVETAVKGDIVCFGDREDRVIMKINMDTGGGFGREDFILPYQGIKGNY